MQLHVSKYCKKQQAIQRICVSGKKRVRKPRLKEFNVCTGWTQEWVSPEQLRSRTCLDIREVVRGPFLSPKLLQIRPYVDTPLLEAKENFHCTRPGIPDTWREHLASRGYCGETEARVLQKNSIPYYVTYFATDRLWNDLGLPFTQGIPDPWKSQSYRIGAVKRRQRASKKTIFTRIASNYDADDEAETEYVAARSYSKSLKEFAGNGKYYLDERQDESNLPLFKKEAIQTVEHALKNNGKNERENIDQAAVCQYRLPLSSKTVLRKSKDTGPITEKTKEIRRESVRRKCVTSRNKSLIPVQDKSPRKAFDHSNLKRTVKKIVQTDLIEKPLESFQTLPNVMFCSCAWQGHVDPNVPHFSNYQSLLRKLDVSQRVLCKNCENLYREDDLPNFAVDLQSRLKSHKVIDRGKIYKRTKLKFRGCFQKTKQHFENLNYQRCVRGKNAITNGNLKLLCCRCDCPYLRIASADRNDQTRSCDLGTSGKTRRDRRMGPRERRRVSRCATTRKQKSNA